MSVKTPSFKEQFQGFPLFQVALVCLIPLTMTIGFTSTFAYNYFMLKSFGIAGTEISTYGGYLSATHNICSVFSNIFWCKQADRIGRKPVMIVGLLGAALSTLIFGFSKNFTMVLVSKIIAGVLNANMAVIRTILGEICHEKRHHSLAFGTIPLFYNIGSTIGPLIGSKMVSNKRDSSSWGSESANSTSHSWSHDGSSGEHTWSHDGNSGEHTWSHDGSSGEHTWSHDGSSGEHTWSHDGNSGEHNWSHDSLLLKRSLSSSHPFAAPNILIAVITLITAIVLFLFLEETLPERRSARDFGLKIGDYIKGKLGVKNSVHWEPIDADEESNPSSILMKDFDVDTEDLDTDDSKSSTKPHAEVSIEEDDDRRFNYDVVQSTISHFIMTFHIGVFHEFLPLFLGAKALVSDLSFPIHIKGGLGLDVKEIGYLYAISGFFGIFVVLGILPYMNKKFTPLKSYRIGLFLFSICYFTLPEIVFTLSPSEENPLNNLTKSLLVLNSLVKEFASVLAFAQIVMIIHRSTNSKHRSMVNGYAVSLSGISSIFSPLIWGSLMSQFEKLGITAIFWWILALVSVIGFGQTFFMNEV